MLVKDFDYELPEELIAQDPIEDRSASRLMVLDRQTGETSHHIFREIADMLVAVNRPYGKSDYIPCISWGRNARFASNFEVGSRVQIWGRIQSREYVKKLEDDRTEKRTAYEVSVSKMEEIS